MLKQHQIRAATKWLNHGRLKKISNVKAERSEVGPVKAIVHASAIH